jgi:hypothetical protein
MRAALHLILILCVLWCALGVAEPAEASTPKDWETVAASSGPVDHGPVDDVVDVQDRAHHHHCPVAPDPAPDQFADPIGPSACAPMQARPVALASLTRAPPLQPPSAA